MRKVICLSSLLFSSLFSSPVLSWSYSSYIQITNAAARFDQTLYSRMDIDEKRNFATYRQLPFQQINISVIYGRNGREVPDDLYRVLRSRDYDKTIFKLYSGGFGGVIVNNLPYSTNLMIRHATAETNPDIKLALTSIATYLLAKSYQPINAVTYFDHRTFSRGDSNGWDYCIGYQRSANITIPECKYNLHWLWDTLLDRYTFDIKKSDLTNASLDTIIEDAADQARFAYTLRAYSMPSRLYIAKSRDILIIQAEKAAQHIFKTWQSIYGITE